MSSRTKRRQRQKQKKRFEKASQWAPRPVRARPELAKALEGGRPYVVEEIEVVFDMMDDPDDAWDRFIAEDGDTWERIQDDIADGRQAEHIAELERLVEKHPGAKSLYTYLGSAYEDAGQGGRTRELIARIYELFPDYLFARTAYATLRMVDGVFDEVPAIMKHEHEIWKFERGRRRFHITEVVAFYCVWARYWHETGDRDQAEHVRKMLTQLAPGNPQVMSLNVQILPLRERLARLLKSAREEGA